MTILHVDDDFEEREIFADALISIDPNIRFEGAFSAENALKKLQESGTPDLIFLDINMPQINGFQFLQRLKQSDRWANIPVIVYSTSNMRSDISRSMKLGASSYIVKPNDFKQLKEVLRDLLSTNN